METNNNQNTDSNSGANASTGANNTSGASSTSERSSGNTGSSSNSNNSGTNGGSESSNPLNDIMGMAAPYLGMLTDQAGRVPDLLKTASSTVTSSYKNMSTTTKVVTAGALAVGVGLLVNNMRKNKKAGSNGYTGNSKKTNKNK